MACWRGERRGNGRKLCMILGGAALRAAPSDAGRPIPVAMTYGTLAPTPALSPPSREYRFLLNSIRICPAAAHGFYERAINSAGRAQEGERVPGSATS